MDSHISAAIAIALLSLVVCCIVMALILHGLAYLGLVR